MKTYDRRCPYCRHMNKKLYLEETGGLMECESCREISYVLIPQTGEISDRKSSNIKRLSDLKSGITAECFSKA